jgi:hypothetical protein
VTALLRHPDARALVAIRDARYGATALGWCCHGSLHGNVSHDHAGVARRLLEAGAERGPDTEGASPLCKRFSLAERERRSCGIDRSGWRMIPRLVRNVPLQRSKHGQTHEDRGEDRSESGREEDGEAGGGGPRSKSAWISRPTRTTRRLARRIRRRE